jgi:hypothetical protein
MIFGHCGRFHSTLLARIETAKGVSGVMTEDQPATAGAHRLGGLIGYPRRRLRLRIGKTLDISELRTQLIGG